MKLEALSRILLRADSYLDNLKSNHLTNQCLIRAKISSQLNLTLKLIQFSLLNLKIIFPFQTLLVKTKWKPTFWVDWTKFLRSILTRNKSLKTRRLLILSRTRQGEGTLHDKETMIVVWVERQKKRWLERRGLKHIGWIRIHFLAADHTYPQQFQNERKGKRGLNVYASELISNTIHNLNIYISLY